MTDYKQASRAFDAIKKSHSSFSKKEVQNQVSKLGEQVLNSLLNNSPVKVLNQTIKMLDSIDIAKIPESELEEVKKQTKKIQQIVYQINKSI